MSLRTGGRDALEDTETPNPDVLAGLQAAYLAADDERVRHHVMSAWTAETRHYGFFPVLDAEIRAYVVPEAEAITPELDPVRVEAAAKAMWERSKGENARMWKSLPLATRTLWTEDAEVAVTAYLNGGAS